MPRSLWIISLSRCVDVCVCPATPFLYSNRAVPVCPPTIRLLYRRLPIPLPCLRIVISLLMALSLISEWFFGGVCLCVQLACVCACVVCVIMVILFRRSCLLYVRVLMYGFVCECECVCKTEIEASLCTRGYRTSTCCVFWRARMFWVLRWVVRLAPAMLYYIDRHYYRLINTSTLTHM